MIAPTRLLPISLLLAVLVSTAWSQEPPADQDIAGIYFWDKQQLLNADTGGLRYLVLHADQTFDSVWTNTGTVSGSWLFFDGMLSMTYFDGTQRKSAVISAAVADGRLLLGAASRSADKKWRLCATN